MSKRSFVDTMIAAKDYKKLVQFYEKFVGLKVVDAKDDFTMLVDQENQQTLCITNGESVQHPSPGIAVDNIESSLKEISSLGGKVIRTWEFSSMKGANCEDPEGNELMLWQGTHS